VPRRLLIAVLLVLGLAACGTDAVARDDLESQAAAALEEQIGAAPEVSCPEDLPAEVGATTECVATAPGSDEEVRLEITVTSVDGDEVQFDIEPID